MSSVSHGNDVAPHANAPHGDLTPLLMQQAWGNLKINQFSLDGVIGTSGLLGAEFDGITDDGQVCEVRGHAESVWTCPAISDRLDDGPAYRPHRPIRHDAGRLFPLAWTVTGPG